MSGITSIEWATAVWNPTTGCSRVSAGCDNCYAFALHDRRYAQSKRVAIGYGYSGVEAAADARENDATLPWPKQYDLPFSRVQLLEDRLDWPLRHKKPERIFVDSMADLFHEDVPDHYIESVFNVMALARQHRFLVLTKRPERMSALTRGWYAGGWRPQEHVWLGTSVEDQKAADERIPHLLATPAAVRFLSCEPLLSEVWLGDWLNVVQYQNMNDDGHHFEPIHRVVRCASCGVERRSGDGPCGSCSAFAPRIDWLIVGGESGPRARPMDIAWARSLVEQCRAAGVATFVKQLGTRRDVEAQARRGATSLLKLRDRKGGDMSEWPEDLRVREFPR